MDTHKRTIVKDLAKLIKENKVNQKDLNALDKDLRAEAISYASTIENEVVGPLSLRKPPVTTSPPHVQPKPAPPPVPKPIPLPAQPKPLPPPPPPPPKNDEGNLESQIKDLETKKVSAEKDLQGLMSEKNDLLHSVESIKQQEVGVEEEERRIRRELNESQSLNDKKQLEEKRWSLEDKRQGLEKSRWETRKSEDVLGEKILIKRREIAEITSKQKEILITIQELNLKKEAEKAKQELKGYEDEHRKILDRKKKYEADWSSMEAAIAILEDKIKDNQEILKEANKDFEGIERKEDKTDDEKEKHKLEEERWEADRKLREAEKEVWTLQDELNKKREEQKELENTFASLQTEEEEILEKIQQAKAIIHKAEHKA